MESLKCADTLYRHFPAGAEREEDYLLEEPVGYRCAMGKWDQEHSPSLLVLPLPLTLTSQDLIEKSYLLSNLNSP